MKDPRIEKIIYTHEQIVQRCSELASWVNEAYKNSQNFIIIGLLKGSIPFLAELMKSITVDHVLDFMTVSSFDGNMTSSGNIKIIMDLKSDISNKDVLLVEEIIDSGKTLSKIIAHLKQRQPKSLKILTLLDKKTHRSSDIQPDQAGFDAPDYFYVGFGLDVKEKMRNLPYIGVFNQKYFDKI